MRIIDTAWPRGTALRLCALLAVEMLLCLEVARAATQWPVPTLPPSAVAYRIGEQMVVDGLPMRVQGFVSPRERKEIAAWFRQSLGKPLMENQVGSKLVLGRALGEYYLAVQLEAIGHGTRAIVSVAHLKAGYDNRANTTAELARMMARFPSGSRLVSAIDSIDRGKLSQHVVVSNAYQEEVNGNRLIAMMRDDGFALEQTASTDGAPAHHSFAGAQNGKTMYFKGAGKEAMAVIFRDPAGQVTIVMNAITAIESYK